MEGYSLIWDTNLASPSGDGFFLDFFGGGVRYFIARRVGNKNTYGYVLVSVPRIDHGLARGV